MGVRDSGVVYDLVIIGAGPAGYVGAQEAAARGLRTALVERRELGGTCLNRGCIPTKTILHTAELFAQMKTCGTLGLQAETVSVDMAGVQRRKAEVVEQLRGGIALLMKQGKVDVYCGTACITDLHTVSVCLNRDGLTETSEKLGGTSKKFTEISGKEEEKETAARECETAEACAKTEEDGAVELTADRILIATGSEPALPPISGAGLPGVMTSDGLLESCELFPRLTIIGGGVIGMEFASIYSALGCQVTVVEFLDRILANMDKEISQNLKMILKKRGVDIHTGAKVEEILENPAGGLICRYTEKGAEKTAESDIVLLAVGRRTNVEKLFAPGVEVAMERGRILVNEYGQTSVPHIYAAGDVTPGIQLAHAASAEAVNAVAHMAAQKGKTEAAGCDMNCALIPSCVYTSPEIGCVGLTQEEAKSKNIEVIVKKYPMSANGKTVLTGQERGFIKVVADAATHRVLGAQMMCARATDMISEFSVAIANGLTLEQMGSIVRPHPSFSEGISEAVR